MGTASIPETIPSHRPISPWREMGAYEALWAEEKAWFKSIAEKFAAHPGAVPSDFFALNGHGDIPEAYAQKAHQLLQEGGVRHYGLRIHGASGYPAQLRDAEYPIELLYYQGYWDLVFTRCVAIVGTRQPSEDGVRRTQKLARLLAEDGFTIVSGLAHGIDTTAHRTAIESGFPTIAVIGTPLSAHYPRENADLQSLIAREHLLVSQVPVCRYFDQDWRINRGFFPERNVTMSALSEATIIVEASDTSGTLTQARAALKQNRKLFILDSCFSVAGLKWPHSYEKRGAIRVKNYDEIRIHLNA